MILETDNQLTLQSNLNRSVTTLLSTAKVLQQMSRTKNDLYKTYIYFFLLFREYQIDLLFNLAIIVNLMALSGHVVTKGQHEFNDIYL